MATRFPNRIVSVSGLLALAAALSSCRPWEPAALPTGTTIAAAAPELQDMTVEHGGRARPNALTLCETPGAAVTFDKQIERQVFDVLTSYKTGLSDTLERLTAKTIVAEAERYGMDPWLVVGVIRVESRFNNFAVSNKNARGLMQIRPFVAEELAEDLGVTWSGADSLYNPVKNVKLGVFYLAVLQRRFGGNLERSLMAYNMGPNRVREWLKAGRELPTGYAELARDYQDLLGRIGRASVAGRDLRTPITRVERMMAKKHHAENAPVVVELESSDIATDASTSSILGSASEPAIELDDSTTPEPTVVGATDGGLADALIAEEAETKLVSPEPAIN